MPPDYELVPKEEMSLPLSNADLRSPSVPPASPGRWAPRSAWQRTAIISFAAAALMLILVRASPDTWDSIQDTVRKAPSYLPHPDPLGQPTRPAYDDRPWPASNATQKRLSTYNGMRGAKLEGILKPTTVPNHETTTCPLDSSSFARYAPLSRGQGPILLAMNLFENEAVLPTFLRELPILISFLDPRRLHVSIYENGSKDRTVELIRHLCWQLDQVGASFTVHSVGEAEISHKEEGHRIHVLAALRNKLLLPLADPEVAEPGGHFETVLFINDVFLCVTDILEVLLQRRMQKAHLACAMDWNWDPPRFYDQWVTRDIEGYTFYAKKAWETTDRPTPFPRLPEARKRYEKLLPVQMASCWNGIAAFSAAAFLPPHSIAFRTSHDTSDHSECLLVSLDLFKAGLGRIVIAPRANVAYTVGDYEAARRTAEPAKLGLETGAWSEQERVDFHPEPPGKVLVYPVGFWGDGEWVRWDEI